MNCPSVPAWIFKPVWARVVWHPGLPSSAHSSPPGRFWNSYCDLAEFRSAVRTFPGAADNRFPASSTLGECSFLAPPFGCPVQFIDLFLQALRIHIRPTMASHFLQVPLSILCFFLFIRLLDLLQQFMDLFLHPLLIAILPPRPDHLVLVPIRLDLRPIHKILFQLHLAFLR